MSDKTIATERMRALLDKRGVEWEDMSIRPYVCTSWRDPDGEPCTALEGSDDIPDGKLSVQALLSPDQAVEATLGRGTCKMKRVEDEQRILHGWLECSECGPVYPPVNDGIAQAVAFCPFCGRKVEA